MKDFLRKIKLITNFRIELQISQHEFAARLVQIVDHGSTTGFLDGFDGFDFRAK
jgi:hypothetical protein